MDTKNLSKARFNIIFAILSVTAGLMYYTPYLRYTFYDQMTATLSLNDIQMGVLSSAVSIMSTVCYLPGGYLADKFSSRDLIGFSSIAMALLSVVYAFTTNYPILIVVHLLYGIFSIATFWSAYLKTIQSLGSEEQQAKLFGISEAVRGIGQTLFGFGSVWIIGSFANISLGFRGVVLLCAAGYLLLGILTFIFVPKSSPQDYVAMKIENQPKEHKFRNSLKSYSTWLCIMLIISAYALWSVSNGYLTTYSVRILKIPTQLASTLGILRSYIIVFVAGVAGGYFMDRFTYRGKAFMVTFALAFAIVTGILLTNKMVAVCITLTVILTLVTNIMKSTYWSILGQAGIPVNMTAIATGVISFVAFIPDFLFGPICGSWLTAAETAGNLELGFNKIFYMMLGFAILGIVSGFMLLRHTQKIKNMKS